MYVVDYLTEVPSRVVRKWMHVVGYLTEVPLGIICDKSTDSYCWIGSSNPAKDDIWHFLTSEKFVQIQFCNKNVFRLIIPSGQYIMSKTLFFVQLIFKSIFAVAYSSQVPSVWPPAVSLFLSINPVTPGPLHFRDTNRLPKYLSHFRK